MTPNPSTSRHFDDAWSPNGLSCPAAPKASGKAIPFIFSCRTKHVNYVLQSTLHVAQTPHRMRWAVRPQPRVKDLRPTPERTTRQQKQRRKGCWACAANKRPTKHQFHSRRKGKAIQDGHTSHLSFGLGLATTVRPLVGSVAPGLSIAVLSFFFSSAVRAFLSHPRVRPPGADFGSSLAALVRDEFLRNRFHAGGGGNSASSTISSC